MAFWNFFPASPKDGPGPKHGLHAKAREFFPESSEKDLIVLTCMAGLLARVAYTDLSIDSQEEKSMEEALGAYGKIPREQAQGLTQLAVAEMKALAGQENHLYCYELNEHLSTEEKYQLLLALFAVAASDQRVENAESEEIRLIAKGLLLEHRHFVAARATVKKNLGALS